MILSRAISHDQLQDKSMTMRRTVSLAMRHAVDAVAADAVDADAAKGLPMHQPVSACAVRHRFVVRHMTDQSRRCRSPILMATHLAAFRSTCSQSDVVPDAYSHLAHLDARSALDRRASQTKLRARSVTVRVAPICLAAWTPSPFRPMLPHSSAHSSRRPVALQRARQPSVARTHR